MDKVKLDKKTRAIFQKLGSEGGSKTAEIYGKEHFSKAGKLGGEKNKAKGSEYFKKIRAMVKKKKDDKERTGNE